MGLPRRDSPFSVQSTLLQLAARPLMSRSLSPPPGLEGGGVSPFDLTSPSSLQSMRSTQPGISGLLAQG